MRACFVVTSIVAVLVLGVILGASTQGAVTDFDFEAKASVAALQAHDVAGFLEHCPAYCGSLVLRAPFALIPGLERTELYAAIAAPGALIAILFGALLWRRAAERRTGGVARPVLAMALAAVNPLTISALLHGHPEEIIVAVAIAGAALAAMGDRALLAGVLLGIAVGSKLWPVIAVLPVLLLVRRGRRTTLVAVAIVAGLLLLPMALKAGAALDQTAAVATDSGTVVEPAQIFWFLGDPDIVVRDRLGEVEEGYRMPPAWVAAISHPLVVLVPLVLAALLWRRLCSRRSVEDALLLLALVLLLRGLLDTWNTAYYPLSFLIAVLIWELHTRSGPPLRTLAATIVAWLLFMQLPDALAPDAIAAAYLVCSLPLAVAMLLRLVRGTRSAAAHTAVQNATTRHVAASVATHVAGSPGESTRPMPVALVSMAARAMPATPAVSDRSNRSAR